MLIATRAVLLSSRLMHPRLAWLALPSLHNSSFINVTKPGNASSTFHLLPTRLSNSHVQRKYHAFCTLTSANPTPLNPPTTPSPPPTPALLTTSNVPLDLLSPMMRHYVITKRHLLSSLSSSSSSPRSLLQLYRVGDFFEAFFEDARLLSSLCEIALTSKDSGKALGCRVPMAGVPHYAIDDKIKILLESNVTVAVVDQVQNAAEVPAGKLVERAVTRLITPGTASDDALLDARRSCYLASLVVRGGKRKGGGWNVEGMRFGFAYADVSTGEFRVTDGKGLEAMQRLLANVEPKEVLISGEGVERVLGEITGVVVRREGLGETAAERVLEGLYGVDNVESIGMRGRGLWVEAAGELVDFARGTLGVGGGEVLFDRLEGFGLADVMLLDEGCLRNMEIVETARDGKREGSLLWSVDRTETVMGARCLRNWLLAPSVCLETIAGRHEVVEALMNAGGRGRREIQIRLRNIADVERLGGRVGAQRATPREMRWLCESILKFPAVLRVLKDCLEENGNGNEMLTQMLRFVSDIDNGLIRFAEQVDRGFVNPAPTSLISEMFIRAGVLSKENWDIARTRIFLSGYSEELDNLRKAVDEPDKWIAALEEQEQRRSGIDTLRIKHIKNTGHVLRIQRSVGERKMTEDPMFFAKLGYERVQSTKAEIRFRFEQLKQHEKTHNSALSEVLLLELRMYNNLQKQLAQYVSHMRDVAKRIAAIDVLAGFAQVGEEQQYVRPIMRPASERILNVEDARHAVVEQTLPVQKTFVPNSFQLGSGHNRPYPDLMILCGGNATGKSVALRTVGLMCLLAQAGSFVPASKAELSICDRIFTRVGAVDDVARGQSTFQVEMAETACILSHATESSLVLLDEIGRGTSTVDGIAIAWSVCEYLANRERRENKCAVAGGARGMFATHYHELNELAGLEENVASFRVHMEKRERVVEGGGTEVEWITTHKVVMGASFESLGLAIAKRAGFPKIVIDRAEQIAAFLREPSKALGAELKVAMANMGEADVRKAHGEEVDEACTDLSSTSVSSESSGDAPFQEGYEKGYEAARAEMLAQMHSMLTKFRPPSTPLS